MISNLTTLDFAHKSLLIRGGFFILPQMRFFFKYFLAFCGWMIGHQGYNQEINLLFLGDIMQHDSQIASAYDPVTKTYNYRHNFQYLDDVMSATDFTIANLEFTFGGRPFKGYPMFSAPDAMATALKDVGVDVLVTANNHSCDRRKKGILRTLDVLDSIGFQHTGTFRSQEARDTLYPLILNKRGIRLALLNYTYGTNGLPVPAPGMVNLIDEEKMIADLKKARTLTPDKIIVFMHWGSEYTHNPNDKQKRVAELLFKNGADIVIGAHPHVIQPMYNQWKDSTDQVLVYSLGNFISGQRKPPRDGGAAFVLTLNRDEDGEVRVNKAGYLLTWVWRPTQVGRSRYYVMPAAKHENDTDLLDAFSSARMKAYVKQARAILDNENINVGEYIWNQEVGWLLK